MQQGEGAMAPKVAPQDEATDLPKATSLTPTGKRKEPTLADPMEGEEGAGVALMGVAGAG